MVKPTVEIIEQPAERSYRFRYESENRNSGSVVGERSTHNNPTYPKIRINNYTGPITLFISCVTNDARPKQHPHKLSSKNKETNGVYIRNYDTYPPVLEFKDIAIVFVKKENIYSSLYYRKDKNIDPTNGRFSHMDKPQLIDLHCVRLCFQVIGRTNDPMKPINVGYAVSNKITDKRIHGSLNIVELSSAMSQAQGGDKILIFCDRVKREDISIVFYEEEQHNDANNGHASKRVWERKLNYQNCKSMVIHHQYGIKFNTPSYRDSHIMEARQCFIQLHRPSDNHFSAPIPFEFVPNDQTTKSIHLINGKRKKCRKMNETVTPLLNAFAANEAKKNDCKLKTLKGLLNTHGNHLAEMNRNNHVKQPTVNDQPLIDFSDVDDKENVFEAYQMQNQMYDNLNQVVNRQFELPHTAYAPNNVASNPHTRPPTAYCSASTQSPYANAHFDPLNHAQMPYMPTNAYQQPPPPPPLQQHQPHVTNNYANEFPAGIQHMYTAMHDSSVNFHHLNRGNNVLASSTPTPNHNFDNRSADANCDANLSNFSDMVQSTELFRAAMDISNLPDIGRLSSNLEAQLSIE